MFIKKNLRVYLHHTALPHYASTATDMSAHKPCNMNAAPEAPELNVNAGDSFFIRVGTRRFIVDVVDVQCGDAEAPTKYRLRNLNQDYDRTFTASELHRLMHSRNLQGHKILERS